MTWSQWVASAYNTDDYVEYGGHIWTSSLSMTIQYNTTSVLASDSIIANTQYTLSGGGDNN
jgi:hypothetical protein